MIDRLAIIGVGLIGGSIARAARRNSLCNRIVGSGRDVNELKKAVELGVIDEFHTSIADAIKDADLIVVAVPLGAMPEVYSAMRGHLNQNAILTDVGSAKSGVIADVQAAFGELPPRFVPGHPIAGTERSGVAASFAELFDGRSVILTPDNTTDTSAVEVVKSFWTDIGADVVIMEAQHHDEVLAATSHLPHILAYALVDTLARMQEHREIFCFAAGGFRDFTRIASSDPRMWRDICLSNRDALLDVLTRFQNDLDQVKQLIKQGDGVAIEALFKRAKQARDQHVMGKEA